MTNVADDYLAFCFDTTAATDEWWALGATAGVTATGHSATGTAPVQDVYQTLRIEADAAGAQARFYINGALEVTLTADAVTATDLLSPIVTCQSLASDTKTVDIDYIYVAARRD